MTNLLIAGVGLFVFLLGYWLGRRNRFLTSTDNDSQLDREYFVGLNYLLNEQTDEAIDTFIKALKINSETIETHIALGQLFCRRGEVDKAIHVHQQLLARSTLTPEQNAQVLLELAKDYTNAGLLDRAEALLTEVSKSSTKQRWSAFNELMLLYEKEKEWGKAIDAGKQLVYRKQSRDNGIRLAHYCCEQAVICIDGANIKQAYSNLFKALNYDPECIRASLLLGQLEYQQQRYKESIKALQRVSVQDSRFVIETFPLLRQNFACIDNDKGYSNWLLKNHKETPSLGGVLGITELLAEKDSVKEASYFLIDQLQHWPSLKGLVALIDLHLTITAGKNHRNLQLLKQLMLALLKKQPAYVCSFCGFESQKLHWQCPGCSNWGGVLPTVV